MFQAIEDLDSIKIQEKRREKLFESLNILNRSDVPFQLLQLYLDVMKNYFNRTASRLSSDTSLLWDVDHYFFSGLPFQHPWRQVSGIFDEEYSRSFLNSVDSFYHYTFPDQITALPFSCQISTPLRSGVLQRFFRLTLLKIYLHTSHQRKRCFIRTRNDLKYIPHSHIVPLGKGTGYLNLVLNILPMDWHSSTSASKPGSFLQSDLILNSTKSFTKKSDFHPKKKTLQKKLVLTCGKSISKNQKHYRCDVEFLQKMLFNRRNDERKLQNKPYRPFIEGHLVSYCPASCRTNLISYIDQAYEPSFASLTEVQRQNKALWILKKVCGLLSEVSYSTHIQYIHALCYISLAKVYQIPPDNGITKNILEHLLKTNSRLRVILVMGFAGKTIVSTQIASGLTSTGYRVGLLTSPHVLTTRERISVNGCFITNSEFFALFCTLVSLMKEGGCPSVSYSQWILLIAIAHFQKHDCHIAVVEVGASNDLDPHGVDLTPFIQLFSLCSIVFTALQPSERSAVCCTPPSVLLNCFQRYLSKSTDKNFNIICGPSVIKDIRTPPEDLELFLRTTDLHSKMILVGPKGSETFLEENTRIAYAALKHLNILCFSSNFQTVLSTSSLFRFQTLDFRFKQLAARHIHYYLQFAYDVTRRMHFQWRTLAVIRPELFVHFFEKPRKHFVQTLPGDCLHYNDYLKALLKRFPKKNSGFNEISVMRRNCHTSAPLKSHRSHANSHPKCNATCKRCEMLTQMIRVIVPEKNAISPKREPTGHIQNKSDNSAFFKGVNSFLVHCTEPVETWPTIYSKRLSFDNKIALYRSCSRKATRRMISRLEKKRARLSYLLNGLEDLKHRKLQHYSFQRFSAYNNEKLYWSFQDVVKLRERDSKSIRRHDPCSYDHLEDLPHLFTKKNSSSLKNIEGIGIPSQLQRLLAVIKARIKQSDIFVSQLKKMHWLFPVPPAVVITSSQTTLAFERSLVDFRQLYPGSQIRICLIQSDLDSFAFINSIFPILNAVGQDPTYQPSTIMGIHLLQARNPDAKTLSKCLLELCTDHTIEKRVRLLMLNTFIDQIQYQLDIAPPVSPVPLELLRLVVMQQVSNGQGFEDFVQKVNKISALEHNLVKRLKVFYKDPALCKKRLKKKIYTLLDSSEKYRREASLFKKYCQNSLDLTSSNNSLHHAARVCKGNFRVLQRMHRICFNNQISSIHHARSISYYLLRKTKLFTYRRVYLKYVSRQPLPLLQLGMTWNSLWSFVHRAREEPCSLTKSFIMNRQSNSESQSVCNGQNKSLSNSCRKKNLASFPYSNSVFVPSAKIQYNCISNTLCGDNGDINFTQKEKQKELNSIFSNENVTHPRKRFSTVNSFEKELSRGMPSNSNKNKIKSQMSESKVDPYSKSTLQALELVTFCVSETAKESSTKREYDDLLRKKICAGNQVKIKNISEFCNEKHNVFRWLTNPRIFMLPIRGRHAFVSSKVYWAEFHESSQNGPLFLRITSDSIPCSVVPYASQYPVSSYFEVFIPMKIYCDTVASKAWYGLYEYMKSCKRHSRERKNFSWRYKQKINKTSKWGTGEHKKKNWFFRLITRHWKFHKQPRLEWMWSQIQQVVWQHILLVYNTVKEYGPCLFENNSECPVWIPRLSTQRNKTRKTLLEEKLKQDVKAFLKKLAQMSSEHTSLRVKQLVRFAKKGKRNVIDVVQYGDLQLQLSLAFQKAAAERSVLLICTNPSMAAEIATTFGIGALTRKIDPILPISSHYKDYNAVTAESLKSSFECWQNSTLRQRYFSKGYASLSPAALCTEAANSYLSYAYSLRKQKEFLRQIDLARYFHGKEYML